MKTKLNLCLLAITLLGALALTAARAADVTPTEARAIAKEAYIYGYPTVDGYRIQYAYCVDRENPEYKAPWNQLRNIPRVFTPEDKAVQTPNSDTPYSMIGLDLRTEPMVLTVPPIGKGRYFSIQLIDLYTHNFAYIGSRATGAPCWIFVAGRLSHVFQWFRCIGGFKKRFHRILRRLANISAWHGLTGI